MNYLDELDTLRKEVSVLAERNIQLILDVQFLGHRNEELKYKIEELESLNLMNKIKIEQYEIQTHDLLDKIIAFGNKKTFNEPKKLDQYLGD